MLDSKDLRVVVGMPPQGSFGGHAYDLASTLVGVLEGLGPAVQMVSSETWDDFAERATVVSRLKEFEPHFALTIPNAGYGLRLRGIGDENLFTEILGIPMVLTWDQILTQAPHYFLRDMYKRPQQRGALQTLKQGLDNPLQRHYIPDSGHFDVYAQFGLIDPTVAKRVNWGGDEHFLDAGEAKAQPSARGRVGFAGNIYAAQRKKLQLLRHAVIAQIDEAVTRAKRENWTIPAWELLISAFAQLPADFRESNGLTPDYPLFWWIALDLLSYSVVTGYRLRVLESIQAPVDFFGNFVDPESTAALPSSVNYCGTVDYASELPATFRSREIWVDITNTPVMRACTAKVFNCFAAGGFMLVDYASDLLEDLGSIAESIMYRDAAELNEKIHYYLGHPAERAAITAEMRHAVRNKFAWKNFYRQICDDMLGEFNAESREAVGA